MWDAELAIQEKIALSSIYHTLSRRLSTQSLGKASPLAFLKPVSTFFKIYTSGLMDKTIDAFSG